MADLNGRYRGEERPTDVLAFPQREGGFSRVPGPLGDVVISVETARRQVRPRLRPRPATARKRAAGDRPPQVRRPEAPLEEEVLRLLIHGTLHLLGHDHASAQEARRMRAEERRCFRALSAEAKQTPGKKRAS